MQLRVGEKKSSGVINGGWGREEAGLGERAGLVVGEGEGEHDGEPENGSKDDEVGALGAVARVHEVEDDQGRFGGGDPESDDDIELREILKSGPDGEARAEQEGGEDADVDGRGNNVFRMFGHAQFSQVLLPMPVDQI